MPRLPRLLFLLGLFAPGAAAAQAAPPPTESGEELPPDAPITKLPKMINYVEALYPQAALRDRVAAKVVVEFDIAPSGAVENIEVVSSSTVATSSTAAPAVAGIDYGFAASATTAAGQLRFEPAESNGVPMRVRVPYTVNFSPPALPPPPPPRTGTSTSGPGEPAPGPGIVNFRGKVRERGTRDPLAGVVVTVFQQQGDDVVAFEATTAADGSFEFVDLAPGTWKVQTDLVGYYPARDAEVVKPDEVAEVTYYIEKGAYNPYEVVVVAEKVIKEVNRRTLTRADLRVPGTLGDPVAVVENLPGVARTQGGQIIVRGSGPQSTGVFIDGIEVPLIYHFGGLKSVIPADVVDTVDFYPGNYGSYYGRFTGGVFDAHIRRLDGEQLHGSLDISLLDTSLFLQVPITKEFSVAVGGRRSYVDALIPIFVPDDADVNITSLPVYYDYQVLANWRPSEAHEVRALFLGSDDSFKVLFDNPSNFDSQVQATSFSFATSFQRGILEYRYAPSTTFRNQFKMALGKDNLEFSLGDQFYFRLHVLGLQIRENADWTPLPWVTVSAGVDAILQWADVDVLAPAPPLEGQVGGNDDFNDTIYSAVDNAFFGVVAPYVEAKVDLFDERLSLVPGMRMDYWSEVKAEQFTFDPRVVARYKLADHWVVKGGVGLVHEAPQPNQLNEDFGNPDLGVQRAVQYSVGGEWLPTDFIKVDLTFFYKDLQKLVSGTTAVNEDGTPLRLDNNGTGTVYGLELFAEHKFNDNFRGWLSYTLSRATRVDSGQTEERLFDFDQTHILTIVASYLFPENWEVGVRWRLVSGNPYTPFQSGVYLSDFDRYSPIPAPTNSARLPAFHQLDLRVDKTWVFTYWKFSAYLSIINTYNATNTEGLNYEFDFSKSEPVSGFPILPILGVKGEF